MTAVAPRRGPLAEKERTLGQYRLVESIASGGMGTVHLAHAMKYGTPVAVKLLHPHLASERRFVAMFFEEARLAARIAHRNVVEVFDVDQIDGEYLIAMRYVEGGSLYRMMSEAGKVDPRVALRLVHDVLLGLHAAHEATNENGEPLAIVHRDVSPQNVLVDLEGFAQLTDFGVARARGGLVSTHGDTIKGKLRYLAPEQLEKVTVDRRADVFACGIVLWELLRGAPLFAADSDAQVMRNVLDMPIEPPGAPTIRLDEVVLRALERDPARRFESAEEFAHAIETASRGRLASRSDVSALVQKVFAEDVERFRDALTLPPSKTMEMEIAPLAQRYDSATVSAPPQGPIDQDPDGPTLVVPPMAPPVWHPAPPMYVPEPTPPFAASHVRPTRANSFGRQAGFVAVAGGMLAVGVLAIALARRAPPPAPPTTELASPSPVPSPSPDPAPPEASSPPLDPPPAPEPAAPSSSNTHRPIRRPPARHATTPPSSANKPFVPKAP